MQLHHIAINNLRRRKGKALFMLLGLVISIATVVSVYSVVEAMKTEMSRQAGEFGANIVVTPSTGELTLSYGGITLPEIIFDVEHLSLADLDALNKVPSREMIRIVAPRLLGVATVEDGYNLVLAGIELQSEFAIKPWLRLRDGRDPAIQSLPETPKESTGRDMPVSFEKLNLTRQDISQLALADDEVLVGAALSMFLQVGEEDTLTISGRDYQVRAVLMASGSSEDEQILMNLKAAQDLLQRPGQISLIDLSVDSSLGSEDILVAQLANALPRAVVTSLRQETLRRDELLNRMVRFGAALSFIILSIGMLVVVLTMYGAVRERTHEIAIFRALGFRQLHIARIILLEGFILSLLGGILGFTTGVYIARSAGPFLVGMDILVPWQPQILVLALLLSLSMGILSSLFPARQAAKLDPAEALRFI